MQDIRKLRAWQGAHALTLRVYEVTAGFPESERFGLTSQMRRSCASIGANIAEGCSRQTDAEFRRFAFIAIGSAAETENFAILSRDLGYLDEAVSGLLLDELASIKKMLINPIKRLTKNSLP